MVTGNEFVVLDVFWDKELNGGTISEVDPVYDGVAYWWKCFGCGNSFQNTVCRELWDFRAVKTSPMDNVCPHCNYSGVTSGLSVLDMLNKVDLGIKEEVDSLYSEFIKKSSTGKTFITKCPECGKLHHALQSTIDSRGRLICLACYKRNNWLKKNGSLADAVSGIKEYYSDKNEFPADKTPVISKATKRSKAWVICPNCGIEHSKRFDAILRNGAYCGPCAKSKNAIKGGNSLYDLYPLVASRFDKGGNTLSSKEVSPGSNRIGNFYCEGKKFTDTKGVEVTIPPHTFSKVISSVVSAYKRNRKGCPLCMGYEVREGVNDFRSVHPVAAAFWDYGRNADRPEEVYYRSEEKFYFICKEGHSFSRDLLHVMRDMSTLGCPVCHGRIVIPGVNDLESQRPDIAKYWDYELNSFCPDEVSVHSNRMAWFKCAREGCNEVYYIDIDARSVTSGFCEKCRKRPWSLAEKEVARFVRELGFDIDEESWILGKSRGSLDIFIPIENFAIEYNGLHWHSDKIRPDKNYHYNKFKYCESAGIQLLYIWEDDYLNKPDLVFRTIKRRLGVSDERVINVNDCYISFEDFAYVESFLDANKLGYETYEGSYEYLTLRIEDTDELVAVGVFEAGEDGYYTLKAYCDRVIVDGGLSLMLSEIGQSSDTVGVYAYTENGVDCESDYEKLGFEFNGFVAPDYCYARGCQRSDKDSFLVEEDFSEYEEDVDYEAILESERVWDAGKVRWVRHFR